MAMTAPAFLAIYKDLKARLDEEAATPAMREAFGTLAAGFKLAYTPESLRAAVVSEAVIESELEERLTSALVVFNRERMLAGACLPTS